MFTLNASGSVQVDRTSISSTQAALFSAIELGFEETYDAVIGANLPIAGSYPIPLGAITKVRALAVRSADGQSLVVQVSSAAGANQSIPLSGPLLLQVQNPGDELTAVTVVGTGRVEYLVAGDA